MTNAHTQHALPVAAQSTGPSFKVSADDGALLKRIAHRAQGLAREHGISYRLIDAHMDVTACHANGMPLRLAELLGADNFNFAHDVFGIRRHLDRSTGTLGGCFVPRFAAAPSDSASPPAPSDRGGAS